MSKTGQHVDATADCLWPRRLSRSKQLPLGTDFFKLLDNIGIPQSADGKEQEPSVRDGVSEDDAYSIQTFGRLIADIISNASELILSEIRKPALCRTVNPGVLAGRSRLVVDVVRVVASVEARTALEFRDAAHVNICVENDGAQGVRDDEKCCNAGDDGRTPLLDL